jgi:anti-sigma regulatory factor (Ser/Thr protein kinase)
MSGTAIETDIMIAFVLLNAPEQVGMARRLVRAALDHRGLGNYADDAEIIASELVTNAIQHVSPDPAGKIGVTLMRVWSEEAVAVVVTDSSPIPPVRPKTTADSEYGRGLQVVEALSVYWDWHPEDGGKAVYAILTKEGTA